jgi:hypothetical protein
MTPTEQDKELREKIADIFDELCEPTNKFWHRDSGLHWASKVMHLIAADRKRVALETRVDELEKFVNTTNRSLSVKKLRDRLSELKAQQEEV